MKFFPDSTPSLLHLLLLAELFVHSSSRPAAGGFALCGALRSTIPHVESLMKLSRKLHDLKDAELSNFAGVENRLQDLPHIQHNAAAFSLLQVNESLSQLYVSVQSFKLHVDWLKTAKENVSLPSQSAERAGSHLLQLSGLLNASLHQIAAEAPEPPSASFPAVSTTFDVLQLSVEISERLQVFCDWSKRVLVQLKRKNHCPKH